MRLSEWQSVKGNLKAAEDLRDKNQTFQMILEMVTDESPLNLPLQPQGPTADDRSYRLGLIEGYHRCLKTFEASWTKPRALPEPIRARFQPPEV